MENKKETIEQLPEEPVSEAQQEEIYTPRPKWHRVLAWVLFALMVVGIAGYYFWIMYRY